jgi:hypothetical protein
MGYEGPASVRPIGVTTIGKGLSSGNGSAWAEIQLGDEVVLRSEDTKAGSLVPMEAESTFPSIFGSQGTPFSSSLVFGPKIDRFLA